MKLVGLDDKQYSGITESLFDHNAPLSYVNNVRIEVRYE
jgi:hypothetical protein